MKAMMAMMATLALMGCNLAQVGGESPSSCQLAAQHLAGCLGASDIEILGTCDAAAQAQADAVLQQSCSELVSSDERSPMFLNNLLCGLLPFLCPNNGNGQQPGQPGQPAFGQPAPQPNVFRIGDCWRDSNPQTGFCFDIVKLNPDQGCTEMLERAEWQLPHYTRYECLEPDGERCRLVRVCQAFQDKGQCVATVPHHNDQATCQGEPHDEPPQGQQPGGPLPGSPQHCSNDGQCGGAICNSDNSCVPPNSQPEGASCQASDGSFRSALCQQGLACKVTVGNGGAQGLCAQPTPWP